MRLFVQHFVAHNTISCDNIITYQPVLFTPRKYLLQNCFELQLYESLINLTCNVPVYRDKIKPCFSALSLGGEITISQQGNKRCSGEPTIVK